MFVFTAGGREAAATAAKRQQRPRSGRKRAKRTTHAERGSDASKHHTEPRLKNPHNSHTLKVGRAIGPRRDRHFLFFVLVCYPPLSARGPSAPVPGPLGPSPSPVKGPQSTWEPPRGPRGFRGTPTGIPGNLPELPRTPQ